MSDALISSLPPVHTSKTSSTESLNLPISKPTSEVETVKKIATTFLDIGQQAWDARGIITFFIASNMLWKDLAPSYLTIPLLIGGALATIRSPIGSNLLCATSQFGLTTSAKLLLALGADPKAKHFMGFNALDCAALHRNYPLVKHFLALGITHSSDGDQLTSGMIRQVVTIAKKLPDSTPSPGQTTESLGRISQAMQKVSGLWQKWCGNSDTPLHSDAVSKEKNPIHYAAALGDLTELERLAKSGADINSKDSDGWPPLHFAVCAGNYDTVEKLIKLGAKVNIRNSDGQMPLHYIFYTAKPEIAEKLLRLITHYSVQLPYIPPFRCLPESSKK